MRLPLSWHLLSRSLVPGVLGSGSWVHKADVGNRSDLQDGVFFRFRKPWGENLLQVGAKSLVQP